MTTLEVVLLAGLFVLALATIYDMRVNARVTERLNAQRLATAAEKARGDEMAMRVIHADELRERTERKAEETYIELRAELAAERELHRAERHELWERIQRPQVQPVGVPSDGPPRKLHYSEEDEIAGRTPEEIATAAGLSAEHKRVFAHIDEIATAEGIAPAS